MENIAQGQSKADRGVVLALTPSVVLAQGLQELAALANLVTLKRLGIQFHDSICGHSYCRNEVEVVWP
eukprot:1160490-Pelagomonas_calceolata.AAC.10